MLNQIRQDLYRWLEVNQIDYEFLAERIIHIRELGYLFLLEGHEGGIISGVKREGATKATADLVLSASDCSSIVSSPYEFDYFLYQFGSMFFYTSVDEDVEFNLLKYVGKSRESIIQAPFLGIHSGYELLRGSRSYKEWVKKAKHLSISTLGICEEHTLGGVIAFQNTCDRENIKSIIGETFVVRDKEGFFNKVKLYVINEIGWLNILELNAIVNVGNEGIYIDQDEILKRGEGLICVLCVTFDFKYLDAFAQVFENNLYYQLDPCEWSGRAKDEEWLNNIQSYVDNYYPTLQPICIQDAFYLDKEDYKIKDILGFLKKKGFENQSKDQYFKPIETTWLQFIELTEGDEKKTTSWYNLFERSIDNLLFVSSMIDFRLQGGNKHLPHYEMTKEEARINKTNEDLFWTLIAEGMQKKVYDKKLNCDVYEDRLKKEVEVIVAGGVVDYFLIVADFVRWSERNGILVGPGRGSAAGCLVSYLLNIVKIDPIEYNLLFERFLNAGRVGKSLPDIDLDFPTSRREEVKRYLESKYGIDYVTSIGTYGTFKIKAALNDLGRYYGVDIKDTRYISSIITDTEGDYGDVIRQAACNVRLQNYLKKNTTLTESLPLILGQPKNTGIHAAGVVLVPKERGTLVQQLPIRKVDGILISEWEGTIIEQMGFLKCDVLGLTQLDKFTSIIKLIKEHLGESVDLFDIPLDDANVYKFFKEGNNQDVFQFGGSGLKNYCRQLKPDNIEDLIATVALYRPGPIEVGFHIDYIRYKSGQEQPRYYYNCEEILKTTYSVICYQEQVMQIVQKVGGFTLVEADDVRKAMGKKLPELMQSYRERFTKGAISNGCLQEEADDIWNDIEGFAGYAFNRSHAACYALMGYYSQWFKVNYPLQFWTISLQYSNDINLSARISEMHKTSSIKLAPPDINRSQSIFIGDTKTNKIYWSITSIRQVGEKTIPLIIEDRDLNGSYYSLEDFCSRTNIKRNVMINLITCGAFDEIENIIELKDRFYILSNFVSSFFGKVDINIDEQRRWTNLQWSLKQRELCGYSSIDFLSFIDKASPQLRKKKALYKKNIEINTMDVSHLEKESINIVVVGVVIGAAEAVAKQGGKNPYGKLTVDDGTDILEIKVWSDYYQDIKEDFLASKGSVVVAHLALSKYLDNPNVATNRKSIIEFQELIEEVVTDYQKTYRIVGARIENNALSNYAASSKRVARGWIVDLFDESTKKIYIWRIHEESALFKRNWNKEVDRYVKGVQSIGRGNELMSREGYIEVL